MSLPIGAAICLTATIRSALVLIHVSRRTDLGFARKRLAEILMKDKATADKLSRVHFLMDFRAGKARYEDQLRVAESMIPAAARPRPEPRPEAQTPRSPT